MNLLAPSIRTRILLGFALPLLMLLAFTVWLNGQLGDVKRTLATASEQSVEDAILAMSVDKQVVQIQQFLSDISATRGKDGLDDGFAKAQENYEALTAALATLEKHFAESAETQDLQAIQALRPKVDAYYQIGVRMAKAYVDGGPEAGNKLMAGFDKASEDLQDAMAPFVKTQVVQMKEGLGASVQRSNTIAQMATAITVGAVVLSLAIGLWITLGITRPLGRALGTARKVAAGELDTEIEADNSEIGQLMAPLAVILGKLQDANEANAYNLRVRTALEVVQGNVMIADATHTIVFTNRSVLDMLRVAEEDIQKELPQFRADKVLGSSIDVFHKNPTHQRDMLSRLRAPHRATLKIGGRTFGLTVTCWP